MVMLLWTLKSPQKALRTTFLPFSISEQLEVQKWSRLMVWVVRERSEAAFFPRIGDCVFTQNEKIRESSGCTTVDGSRSIQVSSSVYFSKYRNMVERPKKSASGRSRSHYDRTIHGHRPIIGGIYIPNVHVRRMTCVEQRLAAVKRLRCNTCNYEITSSWFRVDRRGIAKVLKPRGGHNACRVASKISHFTTVDGSSSITDNISCGRVNVCDRLCDRISIALSMG